LSSVKVDNTTELPDILHIVTDIMMPEINICKSSQKSVLQITSFDQIQSSQNPVCLRNLEK